MRKKKMKCSVCQNKKRFWQQWYKDFSVHDKCLLYPRRFRLIKHNKKSTKSFDGGI